MSYTWESNVWGRAFSLQSGQVLPMCAALCRVQTLDPTMGASRITGATLVVSFMGAQSEAGLRHLIQSPFKAVRTGFVLAFVLKV